MFPSELPKWIDEYCLNENSIYCNNTYRQILEIFLSTNQTLYSVVEVKKVGYLQTQPVENMTHFNRPSPAASLVNTLSYFNRTTHLLSLIELANDDDKFKQILILFLRHAKDVNFFHPRDDCNALVFFGQLLSYGRNPDVMELLLCRKEIQNVHVLLYFADYIRGNAQVMSVVDTLQAQQLTPSAPLQKLYVTLLTNYLYDNQGQTIQVSPSRVVLKKMLDNCQLDFCALMDIFFPRRTRERVYLEFISLVEWPSLKFYSDCVFVDRVQQMFTQTENFVNNSHELLQFYTDIVCKYSITVVIPNSIVQQILLDYKRPELVILCHKMGILQYYENIFVDDCPGIEFLRQQFKYRYSKFFHYWHHRTYCPGSKFYHILSKTYRNIMQGKLEESTDITPTTTTHTPTINEYTIMLRDD